MAMIFLAFGAACGVLLAGCSNQACSSIDCSPGVRFTIAGDGGKPLPSGTYAISVTAQRSYALSCDLTVTELRCTGDVERMAPSGDTAGVSWTIAESTPQTMRVVVARDGATLIDEAYRPVFPARAEDNDCPPCAQARYIRWL